MATSLGGGQADHPPTDLKEVKRIIAALPEADPVKALGEITHRLEAIVQTQECGVEQRYALIDAFDQAAKNPQRKLSQEYLALEGQQKFSEQRLWQTIFDFWKQLGDAYGQCLTQVESGVDAGALRNRLTPVVARALRALTMQLKWTLLRYGPVEQRIWREIGRAYIFAEDRGINDLVIDLYPGAYGQSSVDQELLKALMLSVSLTDSLSASEQEIAERLIANYGAQFTLRTRPTVDCNYCFDLIAGQPPMRVPKTVRRFVSMRFFGAGAALATLQKLAQDTREKATAPANLRLDGNDNVELVLAVIEHFTLYWASATPARRSQRRAVTKQLAVCRGFQATTGLLSSGATRHPEHGGRTEKWVVENASDGGYGAVIPPHQDGDSPRIGGLLCMRTETAKFWGVGVVRRIARDHYQQYRIGIQALSHAAIPVQVSAAGGGESKSAVLLSSSPDVNGEVDVILGAGGYAKNLDYEMQVNGKTYLLTPSTLVESGDDFEWARYKLALQDGGVTLPAI